LLNLILMRKKHPGRAVFTRVKIPARKDELTMNKPHSPESSPAPETEDEELLLPFDLPPKEEINEQHPDPASASEEEKKDQRSAGARRVKNIRREQRAFLTSDSEWEMLKHEANKADLSISAYIRRRLFDSPQDPAPAVESKADPAIMDLLWELFQMAALNEKKNETLFSNAERQDEFDQMRSEVEATLAKKREGWS
jgi:hypothetical protein